MISGQALLEGKAKPTEEMLKGIYSCTMCGACDTSCKVNLGEMIEPLESLYALRSYLVKEGHSPQSHQVIVRNLIEQGNKQGFARSERSSWTKGMDLGAKAPGRDGVLLHIGDDLSYREASWEPLRTIVQAIAGTGVPLCYGGAREGSSGGLAYDLGYVEEARDMAQEMYRLILQSGARTVVTFSAEAFAAFRALYPRLSVSLDQVEVLHISEYLEMLCANGQIVIDPVRSGQATYHDPCKLGRLSETWRPHNRNIAVHDGYYVSMDKDALRFGNDGCYDAPRALIRRLGFDLVELERSRVSSYCCGAGGGVSEQAPGAADNAAESRVREIASTGVALCITACGGCKSHLEKTEGPGLADVAFTELLDLIAESIRPAVSG